MKRVVALFCLFALLALGIRPGFAQEIDPAPGGEPFPLALVVTVIVSAASFAFSLAAFFRRNPAPSLTELDRELARLINERQADRASMVQFETAVQGLRESNHRFAKLTERVLDFAADALNAVSTYTPIEADDELADFLDDIRKPGEPIDPTQQPQG